MRIVQESQRPLRRSHDSIGTLQDSLLPPPVDALCDRVIGRQRVLGPCVAEMGHPSQVRPLELQAHTDQVDRVER